MRCQPKLKVQEPLIYRVGKTIGRSRIYRLVSVFCKSLNDVYATTQRNMNEKQIHTESDELCINPLYVFNSVFLAKDFRIDAVNWPHFRGTIGSQSP